MKESARKFVKTVFNMLLVVIGVALMVGWVLFSVLLTAAQALIDWRLSTRSHRRLPGRQWRYDTQLTTTGGAVGAAPLRSKK